MKEEFISFMSSVLEQTCNKHGCSDPVIPRGKYCETHRTRKKICVEPGCKNGSRVQSDRCKAHGGGKRCIEPGCKIVAWIRQINVCHMAVESGV